MIRIALTDIHIAESRRFAESNAVSRSLRALVPDAEIGHDSTGAPFIIGRPDLSVSISHSKNLAAVAVDDNAVPIGIDIETNRPQLAKVAPRFVSVTELASTEGRPFGLLQAWSAKEAVFKADRGRHICLLSDIRLDSPDFTHASIVNGTITFNIAFFLLADNTMLAVATESHRHNIIEFVTLYERDAIPQRFGGTVSPFPSVHNIISKTVKDKTRKLVFATNNEHKLNELKRIVAGRFDILSLSDIGCNDDIPENADTLEGNAIAKARWITDRYGFDCFADDTGLEVDALGGEPGVHSARYAPGNGHDAVANTALLLKNLDGVSLRTARFRTVIALLLDGTLNLFEGRVDGVITNAPSGNAGFGYDPVFRPDGFDKTFAELSPDEKNAVSHRGRATRRLIEFLDNISE